MRAPPCFCNYVIKGTYLYNTYCCAQLVLLLGSPAVLTAEDEVRGERVGREGRLSPNEEKEVAMKVIRMPEAKTKRLQGRKRRREGREARRHGGELRASH